MSPSSGPAALDRNHAVQEEERNVARALARAVADLRSGKLQAIEPVLKPPPAK